MKKPKRFSLDEYIKGLQGHNKLMLSKALTLTESSLPEDRTLAHRLINEISPQTGDSIRIGITGTPGVGKSTFIASFGSLLANMDKKIAVLTVDPSSPVSGGSILGDKTRMEQLTLLPNVFIRPIPSGENASTVSNRIGEAILVCEAAGYDIVIIESVGVGQAETELNNFCDYFLLLVQPAAGDDLQGMKKGVIELADFLVVNKADNLLKEAAKKTQVQYQSALHTLYSNQQKDVMICSALENNGIDAIWESIHERYTNDMNSGSLEKLRNHKKVKWFNNSLKRQLYANFVNHPDKSVQIEHIQQELSSGKMSVQEAIDIILND